MSGLRYPREILEAVFAQAAAAAPSECCGFLSGTPAEEGAEIVALHEMENVQDRYHEADPDAFPRTSRNAFLMDPLRQPRLMEALDRCGTPVVCIYHSHVDTGAHFSEEDRRMALWEGRPLYPGVEYLVVSVREGEVVGARTYLWDRGVFAGRDVKLGGE